MVNETYYSWYCGYQRIQKLQFIVADINMQAIQNLKHNQENNEGPGMKICLKLPTLPMLREYKPKQIPE